MSTEFHPDFKACKPEQQWKANLAALFITLSKEAGKSNPKKAELEADRGWYWRVLPKGAFVGMRKRQDVEPYSGQRLELRIARSGDLNPDVEPRWEAEVRIFLQKFQIRPTLGKDVAKVPGVYWLRLPGQKRDEGKPVARFLLLLHGETTPGRTFCCDCLAEETETEIPHDVAFGTRCRCQHHRLEAGKRELEERKAARAQPSLEL